MGDDRQWLRQVLGMLGLGAFCALSPVLYRYLSLAGVPIVQSP